MVYRGLRLHNASFSLVNNDFDNVLFHRTGTYGQNDLSRDTLGPIRSNQLKKERAQCEPSDTDSRIDDSETRCDNRLLYFTSIRPTRPLRYLGE